MQNKVFESDFSAMQCHRYFLKYRVSLGPYAAIEAATFICLKKYFKKKKDCITTIDLKRYKSEKCVRNYGIYV